MREPRIIGHLSDGKPIVAVGDFWKRILALEIDLSLELKQVMNSERLQLVRCVHPSACQFAPLHDSGIRPSRDRLPCFLNIHQVLT